MKKIERLLRGSLIAILLTCVGATGSAVCAAPAAEEKGRVLDPVLFDKDKPIEITSNRLDVDQDAHVAVFAGNVDAIQGTFHLKADQLTVHYDEKGAAATAEGNGSDASTSSTVSASSPAASDPSATGGRIRRMDVTGHVRIVSPTETATGDTAVYEVEKGTINLLGNVVLTRGKNVIRGTKLTVNVDSGKSVIVGSDQSVGGGPGRVKSLFVPDKKNEAAGASGSKTATP